MIWSCCEIMYLKEFRGQHWEALNRGGLEKRVTTGRAETAALIRTEGGAAGAGSGEPLAARC